MVTAMAVVTMGTNGHGDDDGRTVTTQTMSVLTTTIYTDVWGDMAAQ